VDKTNKSNKNKQIEFRPPNSFIAAVKILQERRAIREGSTKEVFFTMKTFGNKNVFNIKIITLN